jgi:putative oxidoreductase
MEVKKNMQVRFFERYSGWAVLPLRLALGVIFIAHGAQKLFGAFGGAGISGTAQFFERIGLAPATAFAVVVGLVEFVGGALVLVGLLTRWAALLLAIDMLGAILVVHLRHGLFASSGGFEFPLSLLAASLTLVILGAQSASIDSLIARK